MGLIRLQLRPPFSFLYEPRTCIVMSRPQQRDIPMFCELSLLSEVIKTKGDEKDEDAKVHNSHSDLSGKENGLSKFRIHYYFEELQYYLKSHEQRKQGLLIILKQMQFSEVKKTSARRPSKKDKEDEEPLSLHTQDQLDCDTPPPSPKKVHHKVNSSSGFKKKNVISEVNEELEEQNEKQNGDHKFNMDQLLLQEQNQIKEEDFDDDVCVAIRVDYLKDLETEFNRNDLKDFIMSHLNQETLEYEDVANLIMSGAELNSYMDLDHSAIKIMVKMLDLPLDDQDEFKQQRTLRKFTVAFRGTLHYKSHDDYYHSIQQQQSAAQHPESEASSHRGIRKFRTLAPAEFAVKDSSKRLTQGQLLPGSPKEFKCIKDQVCRTQLALVIISLITLAFFILGGLLLSEANLKYYGSGLWLARASAFAVLILTVMCILAISRDLITALRCRGCCGAHCSCVLNEHLMYHKFCGFLIMVFSVLHTIGHLYGTYPAMSNANDLDELNRHLTLKQFDKVYGYGYLLFATVPGITGVVMLLAILLLWILSLPCVRKRKWEVFSYSHLLYYVFLVGMIIHGFGGWFNNGIPPTAFLMGTILIILLFQMVRRWCQIHTCQTQIERILINKDRSYLYVKLYKPPGMMIQPGQYMFLNLPNFSKHQWHPFSIASGLYDQTINFIIKSEGEFTKYLISHFKASASNKYKALRREICSQSMKKEDVEDDDLEKQLEIQNMPAIRINGPFGAPCQSAIYKRTCVFVGAGVGLTPFLAFLRTMPHHIIFSTYVFICRDPELMNWISYTIKDLKLKPSDLERIQILLYLTQRKEVHCLESFLFWRAFLLTHKKQQKIEERGGKQKDPLFNIPVKISYQRPNLEAIMIETANQSRKMGNMKKEVSVYSCAPHSFNNRLRSICEKASKKGTEEFAFYPEIFG